MCLCMNKKRVLLQHVFGYFCSGSLFVLIGEEFRDNLPMNGVHFLSEGKRWRRYCEELQKDRSDESGKAQKIQRVDGKHAYHLDDTSDSLVGTLNPVDGDNYPNIQKLLEKASVPPS